MSEGILCLAAGCILLAAGFVLWEHMRVRKCMLRLEAMVDAAQKGSFEEQHFDEQRLSRLESMFAHYLAANEASVKNLASQKDKINTLISDISHQTKTPISNLLLYSELLCEEKLPQGAAESIDLIHEQAEKLKFLISSLVKLSRLETGIVMVNPYAHPVTKLLRDIYRQYEPYARAKGLRFEICEADTLAVFDEKWTLEAVGNIVDNAIKYTKKGSVTVSVKSYELFACICISDTGIGIKESEHAAVFGRFYRSVDARNEKGVGIGMFLARQIIQSQGGYIKLNSVLGKGTDVFIYLPSVPPNLSKM